VRRALLIAATLLSLVAASAAWLLATPSGGAWLLTRLLGPDLRFEGLSGALLHHPVLRGLSYHDAQMRLSARRLALRWRPLALLRGRLHIRSLEGEGLVYEQLLGGPQADGQTSVRVLPVDIQLDELRLAHSRIVLPGEAWTVDRVQLAGTARGTQIQLSELALAAFGIQVSGSAQLALSQGYPYSARLSWQGQLPEVGALSASTRLEGDIQAMNLDQRVARPLQLHTQGRLSFGADGLRLDLRGDWRDARWPMTGEPEVRSASGVFRLNGPLEAMQLSARAGLEVPDTPALDLELTGLVQPQSLEQLRLVARLGKGRTEADGRLAWSPQPSWSLSLDAQGLDPSVWAAGWPGRLDVKGSVEGELGDQGLHSVIHLSRLSGALLERPLSGQGEARLGDRGLDLSRLALSSGPSSLSLSGRIDWAAQTAWHLALQARDLDPALRWPDWPGRLSLAARIAGGIAAAGPWSQIELERLSGRLNDQPVSGGGRAVYRAGRLELQDLALSTGPNRLKLKGSVADRLDLSLDLSAPDLAASWPRLGGKLQAAARLQGTPAAPELDARLTGKGLRFEGSGLDALSARALWGPTQVAVSLDGQGLSAGGMDADRLSLKLQGRPEAFETRLAVESTAGPPAPDQAEPAAAGARTLPVSAQARLQGGWKDGRWRGELARLDLSGPALGHWSLGASSALVLGAGRIDVQPLCLAAASSEGRVCLSGRWSPGVGRLSTDARALPLSLLGPWLPPGTRIQGAAAAQASLELKPGGVSGSATLDLTPGSLMLPVAAGEPLHLPFGAGKARFDADRGALSLDASLPLTAEDRIAGRLTLGRPDKAGARALAGRVDAAISDLSPTEMLAPQLSEVHGQLSARLAVQGTLDHPQVSGQARLSDGEARIRPLGIELKQIQVAATSQGEERLAIAASAHSGKGQIDAQGGITFDPHQGWPLEMQVKGSDFQVVRLPEAVASASPDLHIRSKGGLARVSGSLLIPQASIEIRQLPESAVAVSPDQVLVGEPKPPESEAARVRTQADVQVRLGDKVHFKGYGLTGRLTGSLDLSATDGRSLVQGAIAVKDGRYKAYGQDLKIERGRLMFAGPPTNPSLDVRATRRSQDDSVTAILTLTGPLREPLAQVSSDPALPQEQAMAYLLTGRAPSGSSSAGATAMLSQALVSGGLNRSQGLLQGIAKGVGLDELQVQEGSTLQQSALQLGKYLSPDLYVSYALGLFDPQGALVLRYRLSKRLRLEAQSGKQQGVDLIYGVERD